MAETDTDTTLDKPQDSAAPTPAAPIGGVNISELAGSITTKPPEGLVNDLRSLTQRKVEEETAASGRIVRQSQQELAEAEKIRKAEGAIANDVKPWNAEQEAKKYSSDPLESFGSLGSVFAILASAFTHQPMVNALNGSAAAITAARDRKDMEYNRAFDAWQKNQDLAIKRHQMMHSDYQDALQMFDKNQQLGEAQLRVIAAKYNDMKTIAYLDAGMHPELLQVINSRNETAMKLLQMQPQIAEWDMRQRVLLNDPDWKSGDPQRMQTAKQRVEGKLTPQVDAYNYALNEYKQTHDGEAMPSAQRTELINKIFPRYGASAHSEGARIDDLAKQYENDPQSPTYGKHEDSVLRAIEDIKKAGRKPDTSANAEIDRRTREYMDRDKLTREQAYDKAAKEVHESNLRASNATQVEIKRRTEQYKQPPYSLSESEAFNRAAEEVKLATAPANLSSEIAKQAKKLEEDPESPTYKNHQASFEQASQNVRRAQTTISGNRADQLRGLADKAVMARKTIDDIEKLLVEHKAMTGIGGRATRPMEVVGNWFGSNETARAQFKEKLNLLREWAPRLLTESSTRPLSAEEGKIVSIVPGLEAGSTTQNTIQALNDLKALLSTMEGQWRKRASGSTEPLSMDKPGTSKSFEDFPEAK